MTYRRNALAALMVLALSAAAACGGDGESSGDGPESHDPSLPGTFIDLPALYGGEYDATAQHVTEDVDYQADGNSNPPVGGPHWGSTACPPDPAAALPYCGPVPWGIYRQPWPVESLVHNMEHGGVLIWYNTSDQSVIDDLEQLAVERLEARQFVILTPYPEMEPETVALTAWSYIESFPAAEYTRERAEAFIEAHDRRFTPEGILN